MSNPLRLDLAWSASATPLMNDAYWVERGVSPATFRPFDVDAPVRALVPMRSVGRWFEQVHLATLHDASVDVLAANRPIRHEGRTLGELDVLYRRGEHVVHREVAVKFYLAVRPGTEPSAWVGPGRRDRLDLKLDRLADHQLTLAERARAVGAWPRGLPFPDICEVLLVGALFSPVEQRRLPDGAHPEVEHGVWYEATDFAERFGAASWSVLHKPWWLSPAHVEVIAPVRASDLANNLAAPRFVGRMTGTAERAFVVPDGWFRGLRSDPGG